MLGIGDISSIAKKQTTQNNRKETRVIALELKSDRIRCLSGLKIVNLFEKIVGHFAGPVLTFFV